MPDGDILSSLDALTAIAPANLLLYAVDLSEPILADKSKKLAYSVVEAYNDARYLQDAPSNGSQYARLNGAWAVVTGGVASVFGRTGAVVAALNDYPASFITNTPAGGIASTDVQGALNELDTEKAAIASLDNVAFTGAYADLSGLPTLGTLAALNSPLPILNGGTGATTDSGARTNLGLVIGTNVQAFNANLAALAGLTGAADKLAYFSGVGALALTDLSAFARTVLDDANAAAIITTLGVLQPPFTDTNALVKGSADATKLLRWEIDGLTAGATRIMTPPNQDTLLAGQDFANTFTLAQTFNENILQVAAKNIQTSEIRARDGNGLKLYDDSGALGIFIEDLGNIGIGVADPINRLDIATTSTAASQRALSIAHNGGGLGASAIRVDQSNSTSGTAGLHFVQGSAGCWGAFLQVSNATAIPLHIRHHSTVSAPYFTIGANTNVGDIFTIDASGNVGINAVSPASKLHVYLTSAATSTVTTVARLTHISTGTPGAGFGLGLSFGGESSTTNDQDMARLTVEWATATHASRKARSKWTVFDTAEREAVRIEADGAAAMIGFYGGASVAKQTVTGSRGGNAALADLLAKLATLGLITDSSSV